MPIALLRSAENVARVMPPSDSGRNGFRRSGASASTWPPPSAAPIIVFIASLCAC